MDRAEDMHGSIGFSSPGVSDGHNLISALELQGQERYLAQIHDGLVATRVALNFRIAMRSSLLENFKVVENEKTCITTYN